MIDRLFLSNEQLEKLFTPEELQQMGVDEREARVLRELPLMLYLCGADLLMEKGWYSSEMIDGMVLRILDRADLLTKGEDGNV